MRSHVPEMSPTEERLGLHQGITPSSSTAHGVQSPRGKSAEHRELTGSFPKVEFLLTVRGN